MKYTISVYGYGAEVTIGSVNDELKNILSNPEKELSDIVLEDLEEFGGWYDIDNQYHKWGASGNFTILVQDEEGNEVCKIDSENMHKYDSDTFELVEYNYIEADESKDLLMCVAYEKGSFFEGDIEADRFEIGKLKIVIDDEIGIDECYFGDIISGIYYDDEEVENYGGGTDGKSFEVYKNF